MKWPFINSISQNSNYTLVLYGSPGTGKNDIVLNKGLLNSFGSPEITQEISKLEYYKKYLNEHNLMYKSRIESCWNN